MSGGPIKFRVRVEGLQELLATLETLSRALSRRIQRDGLLEAAEPMRDRMEQLAPRRTGQLARTMTISPARGQDQDEVAVAVGPSQEGFYGGLQEFGTARQPAQPFARPAFDTEVTEVLELFAAAMWRELAARGKSRTVSAPSTPSAPGGGGLL